MTKKAAVQMALLKAENQYKDITTDGLENVSIERLPRVRREKHISFPQEFWERETTDQVAYLFSLCSALNTALDIMQQERNQVIAIAQQKEKHIESLQRQNQQNVQALNKEIQRMNMEANQRSGEVQRLRKELRELKAK